jgi:hypothetical protein
MAYFPYPAIKLLFVWDALTIDQETRTKILDLRLKYVRRFPQRYVEARRTNFVPKGTVLSKKDMPRVEQERANQIPRNKSASLTGRFVYELAIGATQQARCIRVRDKELFPTPQ